MPGKNGLFSLRAALGACLACLILAALPGKAALNMPDPSQPGAYAVRTLTYGSGVDKHRKEYGQGALLLSYSVDAAKMLPAWQGKKGKARTSYWGFGPGRLPLNGRVWYPDGQGPFPLVLIVHGNHNMRQYSDPGYAYLGELLASRGFITVSVDENFINGDRSCGDFYGQENVVRAWLLLKHLELWQGWNGQADNPFYGKVDLEQISLIGHSRGGEAAATAAALNKLARLPENASVMLGFGFNIKTVIAIAPAYGQYRPADKPVFLKDVNYLVLQGANDSDVCFFMGMEQYQRLSFSPGTYRCKAAVYINRANHGQFNTVWGRNDLGIADFLLNLKPLLAGEEQRQIAKVYISAFLEATLHGQEDYLPLFKDYRLAEPWLPKTGYLSQFEDVNCRTLADFEEDYDVTTASAPGVTCEGRGFDLWREGVMRFRVGWPQENNAVFLSWGSTAAPPSYSIALPEGAQQYRLGEDSYLAFSMADGNPPHTENAKKGEAPPAPIDLSVEVEDNRGNLACLPLSSFMPLPRGFEVRFANFRFIEKRFGSPFEPVMQRFELRMGDFMAANPAFQPGELRSIRFIFNRSAAGTVILDAIGLRLAGEDAAPSAP